MNNYSALRMILIYLGDYLTFCVAPQSDQKFPQALKKYQAKMQNLHAVIS